MSGKLSNMQLSINNVVFYWQNMPTLALFSPVISHQHTHRNPNGTQLKISLMYKSDIHLNPHTHPNLPTYIASRSYPNPPTLLEQIFTFFFNFFLLFSYFFYFFFYFFKFFTWPPCSIFLFFYFLLLWLFFYLFDLFLFLFTIVIVQRCFFFSVGNP